MTRIRTGILFLMLLGARLTVAAAPSEGKSVYEAKCLYCHSGANAERLRLRPDDWRRLVERMRNRAPLLISRHDAQLVVRYLVAERKQVLRPPAVATTRPAPSPKPISPEPPISPRKEPEVSPAPASAGCCASCCAPREEPDPTVETEDVEAESRGPGLLVDRCSKCHTVRRAFMRINTIEAGRAIIDRMRHKTGSGISPDDAELLVRFLRSRIGQGGDIQAQ